MELSLAEPQPHRRSQPRVPAPSDDRSFAWRVVETTAIVLGVLLLASLLWFAADVLLLLFAAVLIATLLRAATNGLVTLTGLADGRALALVVLLATGGLIALGWIVVPGIIDQVPELVDNLAATLGRLEQALGVAEMARELADDLELRASCLRRPASWAAPPAWSSRPLAYWPTW
jgi:predicted PurR-regulated permease PerM